MAGAGCRGGHRRRPGRGGDNGVGQTGSGAALGVHAHPHLCAGKWADAGARSCGRSHAGSNHSANHSANCTPTQLQALTDFGYHVGLAFQVIDDILDVTQSTETLGKTAGKDVTAQKATYPRLVGLEKSKTIAANLTAKAFASLKPFKGRATALEALANYLLNRDR